MGKPVQLDLATINKTRPSCVRVKIQVDRITNHPEWVEIEVISPRKQSTMIDKIKIHYDFLTKYCRTCKLQQGHNEEECRTIHPELKYAKEQELQEEGEIPQHHDQERNHQINRRHKMFIKNGAQLKKFSSWIGLKKQIPMWRHYRITYLWKNMSSHNAKIR
ncbi:hypothetical protein KY289_008028 [Solanum tuberosum]|nr:hypothetical protein KY289_008028 [Solanum tuberosum]